MNTHFICKRFHELTLGELYAILRLRSAVFVVEQEAIYQDVDDMDQDAFHLLMVRDGEWAAYARVLKAGTYLDEIAIGRVIAVKRNVGDGMRIFKKAVEVAQTSFHAKRIKIRAQLQAEGFYEKADFHRCAEPFIYEGLMHVDMLWESQI